MEYRTFDVVNLPIADSSFNMKKNIADRLKLRA